MHFDETEELIISSIHRQMKNIMPVHLSWFCNFILLNSTMGQVQHLFVYLVPSLMFGNDSLWYMPYSYTT